MIKGIDARIHPEVLMLLAKMGHGDTIVLSDANFPSHSVASRCVYTQPIQWSVDAIDALTLTLSVIPIDTYDLQTPPVMGMQVVNDPLVIPEVIAQAKPIVASHQSDITLIERHQFYAEAKQAFAIIRTAESRPYGNFIIRKGVI